MSFDLSSSPLLARTSFTPPVSPLGLINTGNSIFSFGVRYSTTPRNSTSCRALTLPFRCGALLVFELTLLPPFLPKVPEPESIADHMYRMAVLALCVPNKDSTAPPLDVGKCVMVSDSRRSLSPSFELTALGLVFLIRWL